MTESLSQGGPSPPPNNLSRRTFAVRLTAAGAVGLVTNLSRGETPSESPPDPPDTAAKAAALTLDDHQLAVLKALYPAPHLSSDLEEELRMTLAHNRELGRRLREVDLPFDIEPALEFRPFCGTD